MLGCQGISLDTGGKIMEREDLRKKVDLAFLSAFYGGMLTDNQRRILSLLKNK